MPDEYTLDRETYRSIKKMDREQLQRLLTTVYVSGKRDEESKAVDYDELKAAIGEIKGIGENRLNEIMSVIQSFMDKTEMLIGKDNVIIK